jgi:acyl carrier protein
LGTTGKDSLGDIREKITRNFLEALRVRKVELARPLDDDAVLLETGLDSLGFAILVVKLEEELGYDPFMIMEEPVYPKTFREFVEVYARFAPSAGPA